MTQTAETLVFNPSPLRLLKLDEVKAKTSLGSSTIYRYIDDGLFPRPRKVGAMAVRWLESEVDDWIVNRPPTGRSSS
ncbi:AlpA family transcriptional regulator [Roseibium sp.]|uniref:helix-turn-helix transcriptional regulator n=1 Tax=Roseibium sp. TaxID=1936156 RepID=UPI00326695D6